MLFRPLQTCSVLTHTHTNEKEKKGRGATTWLKRREHCVPTATPTASPMSPMAAAFAASAAAYTAACAAANAARTRDISVGLMALAETDCQS